MSDCMRFSIIAQRRALPAGGWDETTPLCRNQLEAKYTAWKRADSHPSGARCVRQPDRQTRLLLKDHTAILIRFYNELWLWQRSNRTFAHWRTDFARKRMVANEPGRNLSDPLLKATMPILRAWLWPTWTLPEKRTFAKVTWRKDRLRMCKPRSTKTETRSRNEHLTEQSQTCKSDIPKTETDVNAKEWRTVTTTKERPIVFLCWTQIGTTIQKRLLYFQQVA
jgi:hypothetical protein